MCFFKHIFTLLLEHTIVWIYRQFCISCNCYCFSYFNSHIYSFVQNAKMKEYSWTIFRWKKQNTRVTKQIQQRSLIMSMKQYQSLPLLSSQRICCVILSVLTSIISCAFELRSIQPKDNICCFSANQAALRRKAATGWLGVRILWGNGTACLSLDWSIKIKTTKRGGLVKSAHHHFLIGLEFVLAGYI